MATKTATQWHGNTLQGVQLVEQLPKDVRQLGRDALEQGFEVKRNGDGHMAFRKLGSESVASAPMTPSDWRNAKNFRASLERAGLVTDPAARVIEKGVERRAKRKAERAKAQREAERAARRTQRQQEEEARQRAHAMAQQMTAEVREQAQHHAYDDVWESLLPKFKVLAAIEMEGGEFGGGYERLYPIVYGHKPRKVKAWSGKLSGIVTGCERRGTVEIVHKYRGRTGHKANPVIGLKLTEKGRKELASHVERKRFGPAGKPSAPKPNPEPEPEPKAAASTNGSSSTGPSGAPVQLSFNVGGATEVLPLIEALAERLLEALGTESLKSERDELREKVERLEKRRAYLPQTGRLTEREIEVATSVVMGMRK